MIWILIIVSIIALGIGLYCDNDTTKIWSSLSLFVFTTVLIGSLGNYGATKATVDRRIEVLEQRNAEVIAQIEPLIEQYLKYESDTLKDLKPSAGKVIAIAQCPELKGNEFVQIQIKTILENQERITALKLDKVNLGLYKPWLFIGE